MGIMSHLDRDTITGYRLVLYVCYSTYGLAGVGFLTRKSPTLSEALTTGWYQVWAALFVFGGLVGLVGMVMRTVVSHYVEAIALLALFGALLVYVLALLFADTLQDQDNVNIGLIFVLLASLVALISRGLVLKHQIEIREREGRVILDESR